MDYTGQIIDKKYRIVQLLGEGGMGSVYLAEHVFIGKRVAVKFLIAEFAGNEELVKRFFREARAAAAIDHKNIIEVLDVGISTQGEPYIVMEYLEGESLADLIERCGPIDFPAALGLLEPVLTALAAVHERGIVHRDLKPENVFVTKRRGEGPLIKLIDFGISKFTGDAPNITKLTQSGTLIGTPEYMSPEQARGKGEVDHRADIYAVGVMLYEMLANELPFTGENYNTLMINILTTQPKSILEVCPNLPLEAERPIMRAIAKRPDQRFQTALEMLEAFRATESFDKRNAHLAKLVATISNSGFASGDLGAELQDGNAHIAEAVFSELTETLTTSELSKPVEKNQRNRFIPGLLAITTLASLIAVVVLFVLNEQTPTVTPTQIVSQMQVEAARATPQEGSIKIDVQSAPEGSKIYYNGSLVTANPFWVKSGKTMVDLRVEKEGYQPFKLLLEPSSNRVVEVVLTPLAAVNSEDKTNQKRTPKAGRLKKTMPSRKASAGKNQRKTQQTDGPRKKRTIKNSSRSKYTERFE